MLEFLAAYLMIGWLTTVVVEFVAERLTPGLELYYRRAVPCWPVLVLGLLVMLVMKMIEWGLDD